MDTDLVLILGLILIGLAIPAAMSSHSDGRRPVAPIATILIAVGMIVYAQLSHSEGYALRDVPDVFYTVVGRYIR